MNKSDTITTIAAALAKAHSNIGAAIKGADNPFFKSRYADLGDVLAVCKEPLSANGISVVQLVESGNDGATYLDTMLLHSSGEFISTQMKVTPNKVNDIQALGSAITYCRRYSLQAMLSIPSVDDNAKWAERASKNKPAADLPPDKKEAAAGPVVKVLASETPRVSTSELDWKKVVCHVGRPGGEMHLKKLGDLNSHQIKWLHEDWMPTLPKSPAGKDKALVDAVLQAVANGAHISKTEASPEPTATETKAMPSHEPQKPVEAAKKRKASAPKADTASVAGALKEIAEKQSEPMAWREVIVHAECAAKGKTIYEILATERGSIASHPKVDGATWLSNICKKLVPDLEKSAEAKDKILANAIKTAVEETGAMLNTEDLRKMLSGKFTDEQMRQSRTFEDPKESLATADDDMLRWIARNQPSILAKVKEAK